jgi:DNA-directed RNA polymerase specialized sigma24 family protein
MNRTQIFDTAYLKSDDAFKHLEQTCTRNGIDGVWNDDHFCPLSEIPDETSLPEKMNSVFSRYEHEKRWKLMEMVNQILEQAPLNSIERERLYLAYWRDMSLQEIGNYCGRSKSSIHESLHGAMKKIKQFVSDKPQYHEVLSEHNFI